jgi:predicted dehydrogenase
MSDAVVVGLIGCGRISRYAHVPALMKAEGIELRSVCDARRPLAEAIGRRFGIERVLADANDVLSDPEIEAVLIAVPDRSHVQLATAAIEAGKHVLVEKPLGVSSQECRPFAALARASGLKVQVGAMKRHDPGFEFARRFIREVVGEVLSFRCWYGVSTYRSDYEATLFPPHPEGSEPPPAEAAYRADKESYYLTTHGAHVFDIIRFLAGEPSGVTARLATPGEGRYTWHGLIDLVAGGLGHFELTIPVSRGWDEGFELYGANGSVSVRTPFGFFMQPSEVRAFDGARGEWRVPVLGDSNPWERQLESFAVAIRTGGPVSPDAEDGLAAVELIEATARSVRTGERVPWRT